MSRPVTTLAVFFVAMNSLARVFRAAGVFDTLGITGPGAQQEISNQVSQNVSTGAPTGSTLFGMYNVLGKQLSGLFDVIFPGLSMLQHAGVPWYITQLLLAPLISFMIIIAVMSYVRGYGL